MMIFTASTAITPPCCLSPRSITTDNSQNTQSLSTKPISLAQSRKIYLPNETEEIKSRAILNVGDIISNLVKISSNTVETGIPTK